MADLDSILQKAKEIAGIAVDASVELYKTAEEKTRLFAKTTKLKTEIALERKAQTKLLTEIGKQYYESHKGAPIPEFEQLFAEVAASETRVDEKTIELADLKTASSAAEVEIEIEITSDDDDDDCCDCEDDDCDCDEEKPDAGE